MKRIIALMAVCGWALLCLSATAQTTNISEHPGYLDLNSMNLLAEGVEPTVEINLTEPLIRLAMSTALGLTDEVGKDPNRMPPDVRVLFDAVNDLLNNLELSLFQARIFELEDEQAEGLIGRTRTVTRDMMNTGWMPVVRVGEGDESVNLMMRSDDTGIQGLAALVTDGDELIFANLVGAIDPESLGASIGSIMGKVAGGQVQMEQLAEFIEGMVEGLSQPHENVGEGHAELE